MGCRIRVRLEPVYPWANKIETVINYEPDTISIFFKLYIAQVNPWLFLNESLIVFCQSIVANWQLFILCIVVHCNVLFVKNKDTTKIKIKTGMWLIQSLPVMIKICESSIVVVAVDSWSCFTQWRNSSAFGFVFKCDHVIVLYVL